MDWKRKLTSRKFWAAVVNFITNLIIAFGGTQDTVTRVACVVMAGAGVVAYIIGEGMTDAASLNDSGGNTYILDGEDDDEGDDYGN